MTESGSILVPPLGGRACYHCRAWSPWGDQAVAREGSNAIDRQPVGQCRARPPSIDADTASTVNAAWPVVAADDWCAEYLRRER